MRMFQRKRHNAKRHPEAFNYSSHPFKPVIVSELSEHRKIILLAFVCVHTLVNSC